MDEVVERAIKMAAASLPRGLWEVMQPAERARRIYQEMRRIGAENAKAHALGFASDRILRRQ